MTYPRCAHCGTELGDINGWCPSCTGGDPEREAYEEAMRERYKADMRELYEDQMAKLQEEQENDCG